MVVIDMLADVRVMGMVEGELMIQYVKAFIRIVRRGGSWKTRHCSAVLALVVISAIDRSDQCMH